MYIKECWDLHREGGPWSVKKFEEKRVRFYRSNRVDHGKRCKFDEKFWKKILKVFLKSKIYLWEVWKRIGPRKFEKITFESVLKSTQKYHFRLDKNIIGWKFFWNFLTLSQNRYINWQVYKKSPQNEEFWLGFEEVKVWKKYEEKMKKFGKNGPKATRTRDHWARRGKAKH